MGKAAFADLMREIEEKNKQAETLTNSWGDGLPSRLQIDELKSLNQQIGELEAQAADTKEGDELRRQIAERKSRMNAPIDRFGHGSVPNGSDDREGGLLKKGQTWGQYFAEHSDIKDWMNRVAPGGRPPAEKMHLQSPVVELPGVGLKTLVTGASVTSAGALVNPDYLRTVVGLPFRPLTIRDLITVGQTGSDSIEYPRVTSYTNNAASVAEATAASGGSGVKPESALALEKVTANVKTIAHWIPASKRSLSDAPYMRTLIDQFLMYGLEEELEDQIVAGTGAGETLDGILHIAGTTAQAWDTDIFTTTRKALTKAKVVGRATRVNGWLMNPYDVEALDLVTNNEKNFYMGGPTMMGNQRLWGLPIVESEAMTQGTAVVGDFKTIGLFDREQSSIQITDSHSDFFIRNLVAILAEMRAALAFFRPASLVIVDVAA